MNKAAELTNKDWPCQFTVWPSQELHQLWANRWDKAFFANMNKLWNEKLANEDLLRQAFLKKETSA